MHVYIAHVHYHICLFQARRSTTVCTPKKSSSYMYMYVVNKIHSILQVLQIYIMQICLFCRPEDKLQRNSIQRIVREKKRKLPSVTLNPKSKVTVQHKPTYAASSFFVCTIFMVSDRLYRLYCRSEKHNYYIHVHVYCLTT